MQKQLESAVYFKGNCSDYTFSMSWLWYYWAVAVFLPWFQCWMSWTIQIKLKSDTRNEGGASHMYTLSFIADGKLRSLWMGGNAVYGVKICPPDFLDLFPRSMRLSETYSSTFSTRYYLQRICSDEDCSTQALWVDIYWCGHWFSISVTISSDHQIVGSPSSQSLWP